MGEQRMWTGEAEAALVRVQSCPTGGYMAAIFLLDGEFVEDERGPTFKCTKMLAMAHGGTIREAYQKALEQFTDDYEWRDPRAKATLDALRKVEAPEHLDADEP